jgi:hypothetical protein
MKERDFTLEHEERLGLAPVHVARRAAPRWDASFHQAEAPARIGPSGANDHDIARDAKGGAIVGHRHKSAIVRRS